MSELSCGSARALTAVGWLGLLGVACTTFSGPTEGSPKPFDLAAGSLRDGGSAGDAHEAIPAPDAGTSPDAGDPCATEVAEAFETDAVPSAWEKLVANGGDFVFSANAASMPLALHAFGVLRPASPSRALIRTVRPAASARTIDLGFQVSFDTLLGDGRLDAGCTLELRRADSAAVRARILAGFGEPPGGVVAAVDRVQNASPESAPPATYREVITSQLATLTWYRLHLRAIVDTGSVSFELGIASAPASGASTGFAVPFTGVESLVVSCGVDEAYSNPSGSGDTYGVNVDDVSLRICR